MKKWVLIGGVIGIASVTGLALSWPARKPSSKGQRISILYTNNSNGILRACGCPGNPYGGLPRRFAAIEEFRGRGIPTLLLDAGDIFPPTIDDDLKLTYFLSILERFHYDAITFGEQELGKGFEFAQELFESRRFEFLAANVRNAKTKHPLTRRFLKKTVGDIRCLVIGVVSPSALFFVPDEIKDRIEVRDPIEETREILSKEAGEADLVILLSHMGEEEDRAFAAKVKGVHVIVGGHSQTQLKTPLKVDETLIVQAGKNGEYVGVLDLVWKDGRIDSFVNRLVPLDEKRPMHPGIQKMVEEYEATAKKVAMYSGELAIPYESKRCSVCHESAFRAWSNSRHHIALESLHRDTRRRTMDCLMCHATVLDRVTQKNQPIIVGNVQCMACHRMKFPKGESMHALPATKITGNYCLKCHTKKDSPGFNFEEYWKKIRHGKD